MSGSTFAFVASNWKERHRKKRRTCDCQLIEKVLWRSLHHHLRQGSILADSQLVPGVMGKSVIVLRYAALGRRGSQGKLLAKCGLTSGSA
eukprot:1159167-Pelagomonas_calceolata.AAC.10